METLKKIGNVCLKIIGVIVILIIAASGKVLAKSLGIVAFIPTGTAFLYYWILKKLKKETDDWFRIAIAVQAGQLTWFSLIIFSSQYRYALIDVSILLIGIVWFFFKPHLLSSFLLSTYQLVGIISNIISFSNTLSSYTESTLILHIALRSIAIIALIGNYITYAKKNKSKKVLDNKNIKINLPIEKKSASIFRKIKNPEERLSQLKELFDEGLINEEDYNSKKLEILKSI